MAKCCFVKAQVEIAVIPMQAGPVKSFAQLLHYFCPRLKKQRRVEVQIEAAISAIKTQAENHARSKIKVKAKENEMENQISEEALPVQDLARDFYGKSCVQQPQGDEILVLPRSPFSQGCDKQDFGGSGSQNPDFDVLKLYKDARPAVVYFKMKGSSEGGGKIPAGQEMNWGGSGFIIEAEAGKSLVITDNHVVAGTGMDSKVSVNSTKVVLADGEILDGKVVASDLSRDLALVEIETGEKTSQIEPIELADNELAANGSQIISLGQPYTSNTIYTTTGSAESMIKRSSLNNVLKALDGEDLNREMLLMMMPIRTGFSGAAVLDGTGKAVAVADIETSPFSSVATPVNKAIIEELKSKRLL